VLDAARLVFAVHGPGAPVSAVAAEAGVGMGSLYRRYRSKEELLQHLCLASMQQQVTIAQAALISGAEPWDALSAFITACVSARVGALASIAGTIHVTDGMQAAAQQAHELLERLVTRACAAGVVRHDIGSVDVHQLIELFSRRAQGDDAWRRLLAIALDGLRVRGTEPLPGSPVSWGCYARRWARVD
jgi:AcrR family transcriptional regulator